MTNPAPTLREWRFSHTPPLAETDGGMQVKTILNRLQKHRGFVYGTVQLEEQIAGLALTVEIAPHRRNRPRCASCGHRPRCASCGQASAVYDRLALRRFETADLELVSRARRDFRGHRGGLQQQSETDHQKGVRLSLVSMPGNRSVPYTRSATGVRNYPQILLKTPYFASSAESVGRYPAT